MFAYNRNERIENVGKYQSCMVSKLRIICKQTVDSRGSQLAQNKMAVRAARKLSAVVGTASQNSNSSSIDRDGTYVHPLCPSGSYRPICCG
eukprot:COSAG05_NODE_322_length_11414_cov_47.115510_6_plen_91_part_00